MDIKSGLDAVKTNITSFTSEKLCEMIVIHRYLGIMKEEALLAMTELANRRTSGEVFDFEKRIEEILNTLPKFNLDIKKILGQKASGLSAILGMLK